MKPRSPLPRSVCFRITRRCNANCCFCLAPPNGEEADLATLKHRVDWLLERGVREIHLCGAARVKLVVARLCSVESFISFFDHRFVDDSFAFRIERHCSHWTPITGTT